MLETTIAGSLPKPAWLATPRALWAPWKVEGAALEEAKRDAVALALVAHATGKADATALLGAQLFFWARLAYALIYVAGIPWLRTGAWAVSVVGMALIFVQLIR